MKITRFIVYCLLITAYCSCTDSKEKLPILGNREAITKTVNGKQITDTLYHQIPDFEFISQDSVKVTQKDFAGKIYVADFFFTTCPTICPKKIGRAHV